MSYHVESDDRHPLISEGYHEHRTNFVRQQDAKKFDSSKALSNNAMSKLLATNGSNSPFRFQGDYDVDSGDQCQSMRWRVGTHPWIKDTWRSNVSTTASAWLGSRRLALRNSWRA